ncbi:MAG TPA: hypothetical protein VGG40_08100 [Solirubrobacterales bacterium]|jgi:glycosyltransferase involved in cell wall biosynthesis
MKRVSGGRPSVSFISWSSVAGRSKEIAQALGGESRCYYDFGFVRPLTIPIRYAASALRTIFHLALRRPRSVIVSNPPIFPGLIAYGYGRLAGAPVVLDSHPSSFGVNESNRLVALTMPLHRYLIPRVRGNLVTVDELAERVRGEGGRSEILHEAPPLWEAAPAPPLTGRPRVLLVGIFADDEPVELIAEAARYLPDVDVHITGDLRKCPPGLLVDPAPNVTFVGFLAEPEYLRAVSEAHVIVTLTERPEDVSRVGHEAIAAKRPLVISRSEATLRYFPSAVQVENTVEAVGAGVRRALDEYDRILAGADAALAEQNARWEDQLAALRALLTIESPA